VLFVAQTANLNATNDTALQRKKRKRKRIQKGATLLQAQAEAIVTRRDAKVQLEAERRKERVQAAGRSRAVPHCGRRGKVGYNKRTCKKDIIDRVG
jgi:hypothetical protein